MTYVRRCLHENVLIHSTFDLEYFLFILKRFSRPSLQQSVRHLPAIIVKEAAVEKCSSQRYRAATGGVSYLGLLMVPSRPGRRFQNVQVL